MCGVCLSLSVPYCVCGKEMKVELLEKLYFDPSGYQSVQNLYKEAKKEEVRSVYNFYPHMTALKHEKNHDGQD